MAHYPFFKAPLKGNPSLKVTYVTVANQCPRCQGTLIENDFRFNVLGTLITVTDADLLYQECFKAILTRKGSNPYHLGYGSEIMSRIGAKLGSSVSMAIESDIRTALEGVKALQESRAQYQAVTLSERLYQINAVQVTVSEEDPTLFFADVVVTNMSQKPISLNIAFSVPGATALAGSNGKSLGASATGVGFP
jgi:phage baseplate assembly protein W